MPTTYKCGIILKFCHFLASAHQIRNNRNGDGWDFEWNFCQTARQISQRNCHVGFDFLHLHMPRYSTHRKITAKLLEGFNLDETLGFNREISNRSAKLNLEKSKLVKIIVRFATL